MYYSCAKEFCTPIHLSLRLRACLFDGLEYFLVSDKVSVFTEVSFSSYPST